jgi:uncharacterized protein
VSDSDNAFRVGDAAHELSPPDAPRHARRSAAWAIALIVAFAFLSAVFTLASGFLVGTLVPALRENENVGWWVALAGALAATTAMIRWVDPRPWSALLMDRRAARPRPLAAGWLFGLLGIGVPSLLLLATGWLDLQPSVDGPWWTTTFALLALFLPQSLAEELVVRGYPFAVLRERWGGTMAIAATSVVFGLMHLANDGADVRSILLVILAGVFLGMVMIATNSLYAAWMAHAAWNWTMAALLHVPVSGSAFAMPDYRLADGGPDWATGGVWGPEGGAAGALGMLCGIGYLIARRSRRVQQERT